jgi:hypothetical protein
MSARLATGIAIGLLLTGCASGPQLANDEALIAPRTAFVVPPPAADAESKTIAQSIVAHYRDQSFTFAAQIQIAPQDFDLVALDGLGRRALTVHWTAGKMDFQAAPWLPPLMRPADILADIAIVYGPEHDVAQSVARSGATLTTTPRARTIAKGNRKLIVVDYGDGEGWDRSAKLRNLAFGYEIDIRSTDAEP